MALPPAKVWIGNPIALMSVAATRSWFAFMLCAYRRRGQPWRKLPEPPEGHCERGHIASANGEFAQWSKACANLFRKELRLLPRGEVSALVDLMEVDQVAIGAPCPCLRGSIDIVRKYRDRHRQRDLGSLPRGRTD